MPANGIARVTYAAKHRTVARFGYDRDLKLARLSIGGEVEVTMSLTTDQLDALLRDGARTLGAMLDDPASIGHDTFTASEASALERLGHIIERGDK